MMYMYAYIHIDCMGNYLDIIQPGPYSRLANHFRDRDEVFRA